MFEELQIDGSENKGEAPTADADAVRCDVTTNGDSRGPSAIGSLPPQTGVAAVAHDLMPARILATERELLTALQNELSPTTALEHILVADIARHAAAIEFGGDAEPAVLDAVVNAAQLARIPHDQSSSLGGALALAFAGTSVEAVVRYGTRHNKGMYRALATLNRLRDQSKTVDNHAADQFATESACTAYLLGRRQLQGWRCARCGSRRGFWLANRQRHECGHCGRQASLRAGTVMERSRLLLVTWFRAITAVSGNCDISTTELCRDTGIRRHATARDVRQRIRDACDSPFADQLLAGLHRISVLPD